MCQGKSVLTIVAFILAIVAFILDLIGFAAPYWLYREFTNGNVAYGLWTACTTIGSSRVCAEWVTKTTAFEATEAFEVLGFLALLALVVVFILHIFVLKDKPILLIILIVICFVACILILIGVIIFGANVDDFNLKSENLHFAFAFCIIAAIFALIAGILLVMEKVMGKEVIVSVKA